LQSFHSSRFFLAVVIIFCLVFAVTASGQTANAPAAQEPAKPDKKEPAKHKKKDPALDPSDDSHYASLAPARFVRNFAQDQKDIWTSPFKIRTQDLNWLLPFTGFTAGLMTADAELSSRISGTGTFSKHSGTFSNAGLVAAVATSGSMYLLGKWHGDDHQKETGILSGEAFLNSYLVNELIKISTTRERPNEGTGQGRFWKGNISNASFPSNHAMLTWSIASVIAHEYPGPLTKVLMYGLASGVSISRVTGKNHFPSDVVVGSTLGWLIGRQVYANHHNPELWGSGYGTFDRSSGFSEGPSSDNIASPYVPLDSWVYPAFDRLAAMGVVPSGIQGMKPWTRRECARLLEEASGDIDDLSSDEASRLYKSLAHEFAQELDGTAATQYAQFDSVYARGASISGQPLTDSYHFGKTLVNDYGRPYQHGANFVTGFSGSAATGALGFYIRGEFEHAPSAPALPADVQSAIQITDEKPATLPVLPISTSAIPAFNKFRLLDTYVMLNLKGWQTSFGKQSLWLGPTEDPWLSSNNAEPIYMFKVDQTMPRKLPGLGFLGPYRLEFWVGKLTGQHVVNSQDPAIGFISSIGSLVRQPMLNGQKINFKPTPNFEFGFGRTGLWGGPDFPITAGTTKNSLFSTGNAVGRANDPGDRRSTFDFSYRIPYFRKYLKLYDDSFVEDEISPIGYPRRSAHTPGIYVSQLPGLSKMDFRAEASYTNLPDMIQPPLGGFFYWNTRYVNGYTNKGDILGNGTVGRQGISFRGDTTYWVASDKTIQLGYRAMTADPSFLQGGALRDVFMHSEWSLAPGISLTSFVQYEWWNFPLLTGSKLNQKNDVTVSFQFTYNPHAKFKSGN
jgi:capsule assembly protein Wzi/PAP2 superfamily protein